MNLLKEEMRRTLEFLRWKSKDWICKGDDRIVSPLATCPFQLEGLRAYSSRQAHVYANLHNHFSGIWRGLELPREHLVEWFQPADLSSDAMELDGEDP